jgi:phosphatidylserine/phosphatidylglycerophosphate/cardiolipin synthase-like enzyme
MSTAFNIRKIVPTLVTLCGGFGLAVLAILGIPEARQPAGDPARYIVPAMSAEDVLIELISEAQSEIHIQSDTLKSKRVVKLLRDRSKEGITIGFLMSSTANQSYRDPRYLLGWILANQIGDVSVIEGDVIQNCIALDGDKIIAFNGQIDGNKPVGVLVAPSNSALYDSLKQGIVDAYTISRKLSL